MKMNSDQKVQPRYRYGAGAGVDPKFRSKVQPKYGSGAGSRSGVDPPKLTPLWDSYGDKNLRW